MPPAEEWSKASRILVVRLDNLGDMVMMSPALRCLRQALPGAAVTLLASPNGSQAAPLLPWIDEVIVHRASWQDISGAIPQSRERELALADKIAARRFDAALIFTSFTQSPWPPAYLCHLAGIPLRLGQSLEFGGSLLSQWVKPPPVESHQVDRNLHLLEAAGFEAAGRQLELRIPPAVQAAADQYLREVGIDPAAPFIALAPGASCPTRRYAPARFAATAVQLAEATGMPIVLLGSPRETELCETLRLSRHTVSLAGRSSVPVLAGVITRARLLLANDSGPMHIADALDCPMLILFSGSELESQWRPRKAPARLLRRPTSCSPCYGFSCPHDMECLDIPAEEVTAEALKLLDHTHEPRKKNLHYATP